MIWYIDQGPQSDVFISSRVRLARNLADFPFPQRMSTQQALQAAETITEAFFAGSAEHKAKFLLLDLATLSQEDCKALAEKRLISEEMADNAKHQRAIISQDESVSIMINEEDHIRIQSMQAGLELEKAYAAAVEAAVILEQKLPLAYNDEYGYLTACPTNTGTGMRASVMAHLPGLIMTEKIRDTINGLVKLGFTVRGHYGEHSKAHGNLFQVSNQLTLGIAEDDLINDLGRMLGQLSEQERGARQELYRQRPLALEDKVMRAYGILQSARLISNEEAIALLSDLRLGQALGILQEVKQTVINRLYSAIGPASIQKAHGQAMSATERDCSRAGIIRQLLA